jgi:hypothetical protein
VDDDGVGEMGDGDGSFFFCGSNPSISHSKKSFRVIEKFLALIHHEVVGGDEHEHDQMGAWSCLHINRFHRKPSSTQPTESHLYHQYSIYLASLPHY